MDPPSFFFDDRGRVRLRNVRDCFLDLRTENIEDLCKIYDFWRDQKEYFVLVEINPLNDEKVCYALKCSKRGNDKYNSKLAQKLNNLKLLNKKGVYAKFFTITTDVKKYENIKEAWEDLGNRFNRFNSLLKKKFSNRIIGFIRVFEATKRGFPHIHGILFLRNRTYLDQRIFQRTVGAFVSFQNIRSINGSIGYIAKYLTGQNKKKESNIRVTQSILWLFKKRSFSFSHSLRNLIRVLHNSNYQIDLFGNVVLSEWQFVGVFLPSELVFESGFDPSKWVQRLKEIPDPPNPDLNFDYN